jgi:hypothetical protein
MDDDARLMEAILAISCPNCGAQPGADCRFHPGSHFDLDPLVRFHAIRGTLAEMGLGA